MNNKPDMPDEIKCCWNTKNGIKQALSIISPFIKDNDISTPYIRKDIHIAVKQERDRYKEALEYILKCPSGSSLIFRTVKQALKGENDD